MKTLKLVWMVEGRLLKKAEVIKQLGYRKRSRLQLRCEDCIKRDIKKAEEDDKWEEKAGDRGSGKE